MKVLTNASLPTVMRNQHRYTVLIEALRLADGWVSVSNDDISGNTRAQKQTSILAAAHRANLRVETRTTATELFIRNLKPLEAPHAD
jgi:hypothetical protein